MMTTSYPHSAAMHPQGMPHGHPMGGPGPNPGQPMPPGMQHVSGPNGPASQAGPMMNMQPGMGPNAHALSHLQPQQAHMFQQQQQHMMNPAMIQQQQRNAQQQAFLRQQQQQAMLAQQQGGMGMGFQNQMGAMNSQQMAALRAGQMGQPFVNLPPHLQQLQQQQQQMQNQQQGGPQQAAALAQAQQQAAHHQAQQQHMQQQHAIAMQHAQSQSSNHSQPGNQGPPPTTQPQQAPLRPPSAVGSHQGQSSPAPQPTPQQQPQQPPPQPQPQPPQPQQQQQPPQQSGPVPQQQTPAPSQPPNLPQQANPQVQNQAQIQQRNAGMVQQAQAQAQAQAHAQANAQAAQARNLMLKQQAQAQSGGQGTLKLMNFVDQIGRYDTKNSEPNKVERWQAFVDKFFTETGSFVHVVYSTAAVKTKQFEIVYAALPRYFYTLFNTEVTNLQITLDGATEKSSQSELKVTCDRAKFIYTYGNRCQVIYTGKLTAFWSGSEKMEWLQFEGQGHEQYIPRSALEDRFLQPSPNQMNPNQSPRMNKSAKAKQQRNALEPPEAYMLMSRLPSTGTTDFGLPHALQGYLEIYETMNNMTSLMTHYLEHSNLKPTEALESWNTMMSNNNAVMSNPGQSSAAMQQPNMPPGARPAGAGQPGQMFMSPAMANQLLPNGAMSNSPGMMHTPSPASHPMVKQHSTSSHTASVNTSPNMNNKRRRSTVKIDDDGGAEMNGAPKVKQSPRVGGGKRMKQNN